jgi:hypothetical protein
MLAGHAALSTIQRYVEADVEAEWKAINSGDSLDLCHSKPMRFLPMVELKRSSPS